MSRIGMFTYSTHPRGSVVHSACLAEALCARGHDVTLFALSKNGAGFFRDLACKLCLIPAAPAPAELDQLIAQRIGEFVAGLEALDPDLDVLHAQDCLAASALLDARRSELALRSCPLVRTVHHVERFASAYLAECQRRSILEADLVLAVSQATERDVWTELGRACARVENGVDVGRFAAPAPDGLIKTELRRALGLDPSGFVVLSVGGIEPRKNSLRCLEAIAALCVAEPRTQWRVVGGASVLDHRAYREQFDSHLAGLAPGVRARIELLGTVSEQHLTQLYQASDVLLFPSEHEGWGLCVLEAMAAGLPVIIPSGAPFTEYVPRGAALFVDPLDASDIQHALMLIATDPATRSRLASLGRSVAEKFSWARSGETHSHLYGQLLERQRQRPPHVYA